MELVKEAAHSVAEYAASYRIGQTVLRQLDRALWVVEKSAKWAVPPPLEQDDRSQSELVRPLPWALFLVMLVALRVTRETISLANLVLGKPPLRSADVVMYIQSKRRYLRTLKYTGNRVWRARSSPQTKEPWYRRIQSLFEFTMCFRRPALSYGNNNTTRLSNNDEVMVVKRKRSREQPPTPTTETPMERLIERMLVDLDAESDDDSSFTLTNARSDQSVSSQSDQETLENQDSFNSTIASIGSSENSASPLHNDVASSTPEKSTEIDDSPAKNSDTESLKENISPPKPREKSENISPPKPREKSENISPRKPREKSENISPPKPGEKSENISPRKPREKSENISPPKPREKSELSGPHNKSPEKNNTNNTTADFEVINSNTFSPKELSKNFIEGEKCAPQKTQPKHNKLGRKILALTKAIARKCMKMRKLENIDIVANGRSMSAPNKKKGLQAQRRTSDVTDGKIADKTF